MVTFLSPAWIEALDAAAAADDELRSLTAEVDLVIEQHVTGGPEGDVTYHLAFEHGRVAVRPGPAEEPTLRFSQDVATAWAIASGHGSAQRSFMTGGLRVGGDLRVLLDHAEVLARAGDVFASVRADTEPPADRGTGA